MTRPASSRRGGVRGGRGFTLVEILATLTLAGIVLPTVVQGILLCMAMAAHAGDQARAASLAQSKLAEIITNDELYEAEMEGDFGEDLPRFTWAAEVNDWEADDRLSQVDVSVMWTRRSRDYDVKLSTLVYIGQPRE